MLDAGLKTQLSAYLAKLTRRIELEAHVDDSQAGASISSLANDLVELSPLITLADNTTNDDMVRKPSLRIINPENASCITFSGVPTGHEFNSLVLALLHLGGHPIKISDEQRDIIASLDGDYAFDIYISLSCQNCPEVVQAINSMAAINPNIRPTMIDGALFQQEVDSNNIMAVPTVLLNGQPFGQGRMTLEQILSKLDDKADARSRDEIDGKDTFDMLVVGAGPAGASAAIYAARKGIKTGMVVDRFGGQLQDTLAIENFISVKETDGPKLSTALEQHVLDYDVDVMKNQLATGLSRDDGGLVHVTLKNGAVLKSRSVMLSTGARWREMNVPGEQEYRGSGVAYCPHCDGPLFKGKRIAVIGGGNSGIEAALDLAGIVEHVTVLEFSDTLRADHVLQEKARAANNIDIIMNAQTTEVLGDGKRVNGLRYTDRETNSSHDISLAGIFVQIGLVPNTSWLDGSGVELTPHGEVVIDARGQTSVDGVFAAGDVTSIPYKQIIIAMGAGANSALGAFDYLMRQ